ncbi:hypothetical protein MNEG_2667 [Monoraphidium neglectum]|uniref:Uncharacterized protein n=1 Tax=Monoraphidium neglectum TaxID=145388 RepID=A0A0D2K4D7_9CHLO|nr:hypothetical protein MNEG_2667 [Monoraphidium neglectum]KIZ05293.1 hypothetical protein MNEG_2667 [Monoraphidium neglectum]|eukprot:XP_013904312.1 hypothetical protein MNEG_2667 [Monoraphidium neglectum]
MAARSTLAKFLPIEVMPVVGPVALAAGLFGWMMTRTIVSDPDGHSKARVGISIQDDETAEKRGEGWRGSIRNHFTTRISSNAVSIFPNKV